MPIKISNAAVCISPTTLNNMERLYNSKKYLLITHQTIPSCLFDNHKPFNKEIPRFLQVGTEVNKNLETTLEVISKIPCKLIVLKPMSQTQIDLANNLGIDFENKFDLPYEEVVKEYQECDIVLFPTLFEGLGAPIYEGQAAGKPVITTNRKPMNWVAGEGALLLEDPLNSNEYYEAIMKLIGDDNYRNDLIRKGKENSCRFSLKKSVENYMNLYKSLIVI